MPNVQLVRLDPAVEQAVSSNAEYLTALLQGEWPRAADAVLRVLGRTMERPPVSVDELHWEGYFAVDKVTREFIGSCAFKSPPTPDGTVEIAYFVYPAFEGRGYATEMARKLIALAARSGHVRQVIAHTLPERNASTRVLTKAGMTFVGEVMDPEDGRVWRWELPVVPDEARFA
jgi:RimJ/RimL family protein N-acetyltransferase